MSPVDTDTHTHTQRYVNLNKTHPMPHGPDDGRPTHSRGHRSALRRYCATDATVNTETSRPRNKNVSPHTATQQQQQQQRDREMRGRETRLGKYLDSCCCFSDAVCCLPSNIYIFDCSDACMMVKIGHNLLKHVVEGDFTEDSCQGFSLRKNRERCLGFIIQWISTMATHVRR